MLEKLVDYFDNDFEFFIHIDKRCKESLSHIEGREHLHIFRNYTVEWGDYKHLLAIVMLMREAFLHTAATTLPCHSHNSKPFVKSTAKTTIWSISHCHMPTGARKED